VPGTLFVPFFYLSRVLESKHKQVGNGSSEPTTSGRAEKSKPNWGRLGPLKLSLKLYTEKAVYLIFELARLYMQQNATILTGTAARRRASVREHARIVKSQ